MAAADTCIHGRWVDSVCLCDPQYEVGFNELDLFPRYCSEEKVNVITIRPYITSEELVHVITMGLTIFLATWAVLSFVTLVLNIKEKITVHFDTENIEVDFQDFKKHQEKYESLVMLDAVLWDPPVATFKCLKSVDVT